MGGWAVDGRRVVRRLGLGEYGDVTYSKEGKSVVAMVYYRDYSGRRRRIRRNASTRAAARRDVMKALELAADRG